MSIQIVIEDPKEIEVHVGVKIPGGSTNLVFTARHMGTTEFGAWTDAWEGRRDVDILMDVFTGWKNAFDKAGSPLPFGRLQLARLLDSLQPELPPAPDGEAAPPKPLATVVLEAYAQALSEGRKGN